MIPITGRIVTTALLLGALLAPAGTAAGEVAAPVTTGAVFNDPQGTTARKNAVKDHIIGAVNATQSGRTIRAALYALADQDYADALIAAHDRGVQVRVVLDSKYADRSAARNVRTALGGDTADGYLAHSKYLTVEGNYAGHPDTKWTFTGSHNLDHSSLRENDEALLRLEGAAPHDAYKRNFLDMRAVATPVG
ncbi:phosphatidylserine/phosphatidylglycerophosphate/cardiolipin synthase family protein [Streptomyces verrucosisporus]|uniref:phospholipase D-like domain-containing protein n=1 Tax=Streptomyces verrucosisporus TaxID=1695161 RepID=UPI0019D080D2|nr:phospholipase D-like domain-containing protein [Streptomyces verrucosisporus]MBN3928861.1 phosphatidylserine/phosphatidylglycerophosphate/cardiolipin synthase family protein [Streptomyces verrucosisporus]